MDNSPDFEALARLCLDGVLDENAASAPSNVALVAADLRKAYERGVRDARANRVSIEISDGPDAEPTKH